VHGTEGAAIAANQFRNGTSASVIEPYAEVAGTDAELKSEIHLINAGLVGASTCEAAIRW
jgi:hypothetical protein